MKKNILLILILLFPILLLAQMSDSQVVDYVKTENAKGRNQQDIGRSLLQKGVTQPQLERIKRQAEQEKQAGNQQQSPPFSSSDGDLRHVQTEDLGRDDKDPSESIKNNVFGKNIFNQKNLSFTPEVNIPTPANYKLGAGDEVVINVWGASQTTIRQTISPDGTINVDNIGPIFLSGMTINEANSFVKRKFASLYSGVDDGGGSSDIKLTLGQIRTIQINIMGEVTSPGTYSISSLSSIFHALYLAGGINDIGSLREVNLYRQGRKVTSVDIYSFLLQGKSSDDIRLFDGDLIIVPPYKSLINISGEIRRPMNYEMQDSETVKNLIDYAGGFSGGAYADKVSVTRKTGKYSQIHTLDSNTISSFTLTDGDSISIGKGFDLFENRVQISGRVFRPGDYEIGSEIKTVKDLISKAGGLRENAFTDRAILTREKEDLTLETKSFNLRDILSGKISDISLRKNDNLYISSDRVDTDLGNFAVFGMVANPGTYRFAYNTTVKDLILLAGGLLSSASTAKVDVSRRIIDPESTTTATIIAETFSFPIVNGLIADGKDDFVLEPYDQVHIRKSPGYQEQRNITIRGEVLFPGAYTLGAKEQRLSELIKEAGGLSENAFAEGATLTRRRSPEEIARQRKSLETLAKSSAKDSISVEDIAVEYSVGIELDKALANHRSEYDIVLKADDRLSIPEFDNTIKINGAVMFPNTVLYRKGETLNYYIEQAGGYADLAQKKNAYIVYMNGTSARAKGSSKQLIKPGCEIIIPTKEAKAPMSLGEKIAIGSSVTSMASVVALLINSLAK